MTLECSRHIWAKQNKYTDTAGVFKAPVFYNIRKYRPVDISVCFKESTLNVIAPYVRYVEIGISIPYISTFFISGKKIRINNGT